MLADNESLAAHFWHDCVMRTDFCSPYYFPMKGAFRTQDTFNDNFLSVSYFSSGMMQCQTSRNTCTCWRAIHLGISENTNISTMVSWIFRSINQNSAIHKTQI